MTAAPGPQQPDEVRPEPFREFYAEWDEHDDRPAAPSAQPDDLAVRVAALANAWAAKAQVARTGGFSTPTTERMAKAADELRDLLAPTPPPSLSQQRRHAVQTAHPDKVCVELPSGGRAHVSSDPPPSLLRALDALSVAAREDTPAQPDEVRPATAHERMEQRRAVIRQATEQFQQLPEGEQRFLRDEYERAGEYADEIVRRGQIARPATPAQPVRDTGEGRR